MVVRAFRGFLRWWRASRWAARVRATNASVGPVTRKRRSAARRNAMKRRACSAVRRGFFVVLSRRERAL